MRLRTGIEWTNSLFTPSRLIGSLGKAALLTGSVALCLLAAEIATRTIDNLPTTDLVLPAPSFVGLDTTADRLDDVPRAPGMRREWFFESPPPLPNRQPVPGEWLQIDAQMKVAISDYRSGSFLPWDIFKQWNATLVGSYCDRPFFAKAPGWLYVYDPPDGGSRPPFRYLPNATTPEGLVTNELGWRGPPVRFRRVANSIRIVFVGASTTAGPHNAPYSYPEMVGHYLNRWVAERHPDLRIEVLNAGREAMKSTDLAAIVRQEVAPVRPDLVVYYEGGNEFHPHTVVWKVPDERPPDSLDNRPEQGFAGFLKRASAYSALARRALALQQAIDLPDQGRESVKPDYAIEWPPGLDEQDPDISRSALPLNLTLILANLERSRRDLAAVDSDFALLSFMWMVRDGLEVNPIRNRLIWNMLNVRFWPYRYRDMERLAQFQNRVLRKYALAHDMPFIDFARAMPFYPDLFADAVHFNYAGSRLQAWVVAQQLVPLIERRLASGAWPKAVPEMPDIHPALTKGYRRAVFPCGSPNDSGHPSSQ